jgi:long-chain fatty acid transport protein
MKRTLLVTAALLLLAKGASASPVVELIGPVGGDGGFNPVILGASAGSTYFNPALLTQSDEGLLLGFSVYSEQIGVTLDGRKNGSDVPLSVGGRDILGADGLPIPNGVVPTQWLAQGCDQGTRPGQCPAPAFQARPRQAAGDSGKTRTYVSIGLVKHLVPDRLTIGLYAMLPLSRLTTTSTFYVDEREALFSNSLHPELYGDRMTALSVSAGAAFKLFKELSVGLGVAIGLTNAATSATYVRDTADYNTLLVNNQVGVTVAVAPHLGVAYRPFPWLGIGGSLHAPQSFVLDTAIGATLPSGVQSGGSFREVHDYLPWRASFGVEADQLKRARWSLGVAASVKYGFWSDYQDRHGASPSNYGADLTWKDTLTWSAGIRPRYKSLRTWIDMQYAPSPVPEQVGRSNYVDNDRVGMTIGGDLTVDIAGTRMRPGLSLTGSRLIHRHNTKDDSRIVDELPDGATFATTRDPVPGAPGLQTNNPGWPGFASAGWVYGGSVSLEILFK